MSEASESASSNVSGTIKVDRRNFRLALEAPDSSCTYLCYSFRRERQPAISLLVICIPTNVLWYLFPLSGISSPSVVDCVEESLSGA